ncbi:hypothetical protein SG34_026270 [Thalassomonas viridans]|uniref:Peptidase C-terminal archaeal/bacterial domain-containing protein n=1 Tax=Thalassomonas viridans TaxID=137584 RepID=A0AAE9Z3W4_9GAMM|nr:hypothetical protein [Thalassomonas viridans]WDE04778.1 hypothetical protein SG34_026270 [Thalassomonas viridans]
MKSLSFKKLFLVSALSVPLSTMAENIQLPELDLNKLPQYGKTQVTATNIIEEADFLPQEARASSSDKKHTPQMQKLIEHALDPSKQLEPVFSAKKISQPVNNLQASAAAVPPQYTFNGCYAFALGSGNTFNLNSAQTTCNNTYSATPIKLDSVLLNQSAGTDYDLLVYFYNHDTGQLEFKGGSNNDGNTDEYFSEVMPAGNYILYALAQEGVAPISFVVGALGWNNYDANEANENPGQATHANGADGNYLVTGNIDNSNDRDVFAYNMAPTQDTAVVRLTAIDHTLQVLSGSNWLDITPNGESVLLSLPTPGDTLYLRVRPTVGTTVNPLVNYELLMSNPVDKLVNYSIVGDVQPGWFPGTEINEKLTFNGTAVDQFNHPVPYASNIALKLASESGVVQEYADVNAAGQYSHTLTIPGCSSGVTQRKWDYAYHVCWQVSYHNDISHSWSFGIDQPSPAEVFYHHICSARIVSNVDREDCY